MTVSNCVNSIGLVVDIVGAVILWRYGLPEEVRRTGASYFVLEGAADEVEKAKAKRYDSLADLGIAMLVLGFALQLISNFL